MERERRKFDREFKLMAVNLCHSSERTVKDVAEELGIRAELLRRWKSEHGRLGANGFSGHGNRNLSDEQREILRLRKELRDAQTERDILKKAVHIFSRTGGGSTGS